MKKRYLIYLLTLLMVFSPAAAFADVTTEASPDDAAPVEVEETADAAVPEADVVAEESAEEINDAEVVEEEAVSQEAKAEGELASGETPQNGWDDSMTHYYKEGVVQTGLFKAPKRTDQSINTMYFARSDGAIRTIGGPITVTSDMTSVFYRFADKGTTSGYEEQPGEKGPLTYFVYTNDGDCDIMPKENIYQAGGAKYYVKPDGTVRTNAGVQDFGGSKYYVQNGGALQMTAGFTPDHQYYIPAADGKIRTAQGIFTANDGRLYYSGAGGVIPSVPGLYPVGADQYYVNADGSVQTAPGFINVNGKVYLITNGGKIRFTPGVVDFGGNKYIAEAGGAIHMAKGFVTAGGYKYYVKNNAGVLALNKKIKVNKKTYHALGNGVIAVGVHKWGKYYYYSTKSGAMRTKTGVVKWNGNYYHVKKGGKVTTNKKVKSKGKYYIANKKGVIYRGIFKWKKNLYYASNKGVLRTKAGLFLYDGFRYYSRKDGKLYVNEMFTAGGKKYLAQDDGKIKVGLFVWKNKYYMTSSKGAIVTKKGMYSYNGKLYYVKKGGAITTNDFVKFSNKYYFAGSDGAILKKAFSYKGYWWHPNSSTGEISLDEYVRLHPEAAPKPEQSEETPAAGTTTTT